MRYALSRFLLPGLLLLLLAYAAGNMSEATGSQAAGDHWTRLVPPQDTPRLQMDTTGQVVHVGLRLEPQSDGPLHVTYVAPGSAAEREGVQPGDQVLAINGQSASSLDRG